MRHSAGGLPKKTETYLFFQIKKDKVTEFRKALARLVPLITTTAQVLQDRQKLADHKKNKGKGLLKLNGVNITFSHAGLALVSHPTRRGNDSGLQANALPPWP